MYEDDSIQYWLILRIWIRVWPSATITLRHAHLLIGQTVMHASINVHKSLQITFHGAQIKKNWFL